TATSLQVTVPSGATYQPISVTTGNLTDYSSLPFLLTFPGAGSITPTSFAPRQDIRISNLVYDVPYSIAVADLNGDGKSDLAAALGSVDEVYVLKNTSSAGSVDFSNGVRYDVTGAPYWAAAGDLDGDGK